ncbi:MAG: bis(5'-nucleosyl)-tetraphosphatase (symmetrical) YqeK [Negativicoccus massiliensis]|uniref:bis(5'-nucleosyl)-tetraphosphatase (symmetrical) YqeK n=1 Tax=Negativicoccus succinicivorans TaxID=620903 RepID=UPI0026F29DA8|nr:bis(5'-nucleosyl)-tetraphosphatase (symmetrical) YqeK [Negativicoccus succinicivorans]MDU4641804.1 bis(5'-nucleosyl)-tetraphosphatase (symmetrical) YqeK [Negativicoccus massiliensis]MBS5887075.1 bis(5'-nucleosyl)-tetraphosphatase (symmetrical) YqeK [Negativicoccus succinicivorans]MDU2417393.1 bis(5'-nucleosyl)-tetraphosphatase (symmetrical) YqeK [Negativicoccus succinicivorans]MDU3215704.1 bis(5'-nucleosyl)-tetraphosphatase (symmetrical) YqeK [Negativicoccus succinicivorans]MDU5027602.1 bis
MTVKTVSTKELRKKMKELLSEKRYCHSLGVAHTASVLAQQFGGDPEQAERCGLVHDCAKEMSLTEMHELLADQKQQISPMMWHMRSLLHGLAGAVYAQNNFGFTDPVELAAIAYHTTGRVAMSRLELLIFVADYIEPMREYSGVEQIRALAKTDLHKAALAGIDSTIRHLLNLGQEIYVPTVDVRNYLIRETQQA